MNLGVILSGWENFSWNEYESAFKQEHDHTSIYSFFSIYFWTLQNPKNLLSRNESRAKGCQGNTKLCGSPYPHESKVKRFPWRISNHKHEHAFTDSADLLSLIKRRASRSYPQESSHCWVSKVGLKFSVNGGKISYNLWWDWLISDAR